MRRLMWWLMAVALLGGGAAAVADTHGRTQPPATWQACGQQHGQTVYCVPPR